MGGGKNPFAGRKQDVSSSEEECAIEQQQNTKNKADLKLPFGTAENASSQQTCDHVMTSKQKAEIKAKEEEDERKKEEKKQLEEDDKKRKELDAKKQKMEEEERKRKL